MLKRDIYWHTGLSTIDITSIQKNIRWISEKRPGILFLNLIFSVLNLPITK